MTGRNAAGFTHRHVQVGSTIHTDESAIYNRVGGLLYQHETINHGAGEYARGDVTTNGIESVFAVLKRGLHDVTRHTLDRLASLFSAAIGRRITYAELIA